MTYPFDGLERFAQLSKGDWVVNFSIVDIPREQSAEALPSALRAAHENENENRWVGMSPEFTSDSERMEQWGSTAKLRRLEVERIEALWPGRSILRPKAFKTSPMPAFRRLPAH